MPAKYFLTSEEFSQSELQQLLSFAKILKQRRKEKQKSPKFLEGQTVALMFEKPSLRTRISFSVAVTELGGSPLEILSSSRKKEEPEDMVRVMSGYVQMLMLRTFDHDIFRKMVLHSNIPIINGLSDSHHPCQALADVMTLEENYGSLKGLKLAWVGDGNNVLHSLLLLAPRLGAHVTFACPKGFEPNSLVVKRAKELAQEGGGELVGFTDPKQAVRGANAIYTDVWTSMGFELKPNRTCSQDQEEEDREKIFFPYQLNEKLYAQAESDALIMHCMPMVRGKEITDALVEHPRSVIFSQSENRLHVQKSLMAYLSSGSLNLD